MKQLLYFFPKLGGLTLLANEGISKRYGTDTPKFSEVGSDIGPDGQTGVVFYWHAKIPQPLTWQPSVNGNYYIGWHTPNKPKPETFRKSISSNAGQYVTLCDGNEWFIPLLLPCQLIDPERTDGIPKAPAFDDGNLEWQPSAEHEYILSEAETVLQYFEQGGEIQSFNALNFGVFALQLAYNISIDETLALGLLDEDKLSDIAIVALDLAERYKAAELLEGVS